MTGAQFPPLFTGLLTAGADPFDAACAEAQKGCDAGLVTYDVTSEQLRAAIVFAPEVPLDQAMIMQPLCAIGFQNALGALAPPEVAVQLEWSGGLRLNGARFGEIRCAAARDRGADVPDWLVISISVTLRHDVQDTGITPDVTCLAAEGCADIDPITLLEAWARHTLAWINRWEEDGLRPVHDEWTGLACGLGDELTIGDANGTFRGIDEGFGLLLQQDGQAQIIPLTETLEEPR